MQLHPQTLKKNGENEFVVLTVAEYEELLEELEELDDTRAYDAAMAKNEKPVPFSEALKRIQG